MIFRFEERVKVGGKKTLGFFVWGVDGNGGQGIFCELSGDLEKCYWVKELGICRR